MGIFILLKDLERNDYINIFLSLLAIVMIVLGLKFVKANFITQKHDYANFSTEENIITNKTGDVSVAIAGNVLLSSKLQTSYNLTGLSGVISDSLHSKLSATDIAIMNQTFSCVDNLNGEYHVSSTSLDILNSLGFNIVSLSNNYFRQYGADYTTKSLNMLKNHEIRATGAGNNQMNAATPAICTYNDKTIGYISVTLTDKDGIQNSGYAANSNGHVREQMGIYGETDINNICENITDAKNKCNFLIVNVNPAMTNNATTINLKKASESFIKSGADMVTYCSEEFDKIEYYKGCPILYGTGNFLNSVQRTKTALVKLDIKKNGKTKLSLIPCISDAYYVREMNENERKDFYKEITDKSSGIKISKRGEIKKSN